MIHPDFKFIRAVAMMIGAIVGVGVFGIPYAFAKSGLAIGILELFVIGGFMIILQLMYAEIALQTEGRHRLVGYIEKYLGAYFGKTAIFAVCILTWGAMLAYMIVGGKFLHLFFGSVFDISFEWFSYAIALASGWFIYKGLRFASKMEAFIIMALLFLFAFIILYAIPEVKPLHLQTIHWSKMFFPYGVIMFALSSFGIVPELKVVLGSKAHQKIGQVIFFGLIAVIVLYALFGMVVVGVTGEQTTDVAFDGLVQIFGTPFRVITSFLGSLTIFSIFVMIGIQLMEILQFDFSRSKKTAWGLVMFIPILMFMFGFQAFVKLIGLIGGVFGGIIGILIILTYLRMKALPFCQKKHCLDFPNVLSWSLLVMFFAGMIYEIVVFLIY